MSYCEVIALSVLCENIDIDSENYLFEKLKSDYYKDFPNLIHKSRFNPIRKQLANLIAKLNLKIFSFLKECEIFYMVDSIQIPVCKITREKSWKIRKEDFGSAPYKGYTTVSKPWCFGYKLNMVTSVNGFLAWN